MHLRCYTGVAMKNWENSDWFQDWIKLANHTSDDPRG
jgi:hypothetical protein